MHEYTCAVVSVLILCFFLVLRIFWEEQLEEQFWYFNFSLYLVVFWAEQSEKAPCMNQLLPTFAIRQKSQQAPNRHSSRCEAGEHLIVDLLILMPY